MGSRIRNKQLSSTYRRSSRGAQSLPSGIYKSLKGEKMKILITGATGLIGKEIGKKLAEDGHELFIVSRSLAKAREQGDARRALRVDLDVISGRVVLEPCPLHVAGSGITGHR